MGRPAKHRCFVFTHNNYSDNDVRRYQKMTWWQCIAFGKEWAPTTDTPHLQGFIWTNEFCTKQQVKLKMKGCWVDTPGESKPPDYWLFDDGTTGFGYCFKEHCPGWVFQGTIPSLEEFLAQCPKGQGNRNDLLEVKRKIDEGVNASTLLEDCNHFAVFARNKEFFMSYQAYKRRRTSFSPPDVHVRYGPTGTHKTRFVYDHCSFDDIFKLSPFMTMGNNIWFDGYCGQDVVLFEEFRPGMIKFPCLLDVLDGYPTKVQVKGGTVDWSPKVIYICSCEHWRDWYPVLSANDKIDQLERRITSVTYTGQ